MKLSTRARYGLSCMIAVSRLSREGEPASLEKVSRSTGVSKRYLEQLVIALKHASLLRAVSGRRGGYFLTRDPDQVKLLDIVEATIGPINVVDCVREPDRCERAEDCENRLIWALVNRKIREVLSDFSLADVASGERLEEICGELGVDGSPGPCPGLLREAEKEGILAEEYKNRNTSESCPRDA